MKSLSLILISLVKFSGRNMKALNKNDLDILNSLKCFKSAYFQEPFYKYGGLPHNISYGYRLCDWYWEKPYKEDDCFFKKYILSFLPDKLVQIETKYIFMVNELEHYYWISVPGIQTASFEEVFENSSNEIKEQLVYHLDIFNSKK